MWGSASRSGSRPCSRRAAEVAGPIEAVRGPSGSAPPQASARKRTVEAEVKVIQSTSRDHPHARGVQRLGDGLVEREDGDLGAALAQRVRQHVAALAGADEQRVGDRDAGERVDHALGDGAVRDDVGDDAVLAQRAGGARAHRGDAVARQRAGVAALALERGEQLVGAVGGRDDEQVEARRGSAARPRASAVRMAGASTTSAPSSRRRAASGDAWARARVTAIERPCSGRRVSHSSSSPSAATGPTTVMAGAWTPTSAARSATVGQRRVGGALPGHRPALDDRDRLVAGAAAVDQPGADARQRAHAHVEDQRAGEARRAPPSRARLRRGPGGR